MKKLKLKPEFKGITISKMLIHLGGTAIFYPDVDEKYYRNYFQVGFQDIFYEADVCDECKHEVCECTKLSGLDTAKAQVEDYKKTNKKK